MSDRPSLRFLSGDRAGEVVPLTGPTFTIGRRPGNSLQVADPSVSGKHAELTLDDLGLVVQDLGSTNGTRVDDERIVEERVQAGAVLRFGNVELRFEDGSEAPLAGGTSEPVGHAAGASGGELVLEEPDAAGTIDAAKLEASRRGSKVLPLIIVLLAAGAGAAWYLLPSPSDSGGGQGATAPAPVSAPAGELLAASYSFEADAGAWSAPDDAAPAFDTSRMARRSGRVGLLAELDPALGVQTHLSPEVRVSEGRYRASVSFRAPDAGAEGRLAVELASSREDGPRALSIRTPWAGLSDEWLDTELPLEVPPGYDRAHVSLEARASGAVTEGDPVLVEVHADDASLVADGRSAPVLELGTRALLASGSPTSHVTLVDVQRLLLPSIRRADDGALEVASSARGARITAPGAAAASRWLVRTAPSLTEGGLRSLGTTGSASHPAAFERGEVESVLLGAGRGLVTLRCDAGTALAGRPLAGGGWELELTTPGSGGFVVQVDFQEELSEALQLASGARKATREGRVGEALQAWQSLLDSAPYDRDVTTEAEAAVASLALAARAELGELEEEIARARFFRLTDGYRGAIESADALAGRYAGTEIAEQAEALIAPLEVELDGLEQGRVDDELARLEAIRLALRAQGQDLLVEAVQGLLNTKQGGGR